MRIIKRIVCIFLLFVLISEQITLLAKANTMTTWGTKFVNKISIMDKKGVPLSEIPLGESFKVRYDWVIPNNIDVKEGDTMSIALPQGLQNAQNDAIAFKDVSSGKIIARGQATNPGSKLYNLTFTDYPQAHSNIRGYIEFFIQFEKSVQPGQKIEFDILADKTIVTAIDKHGGVPSEPQPITITTDTSYKMPTYKGNGEIAWSIFIIPPKLKSNITDPGHYKPLYNVTIKDTYGIGQTLLSESVNVRQTYGVKGGFLKAKHLPDLKIEKQNSVARTFELDLGNLEDGYGREITYKTKITDSTQEIFANKVYINGSGFERNIENTLLIVGGTGAGEGEQALQF